MSPHGSVACLGQQGQKGIGKARTLEDGRLELDTNRVENQIRPIALTRKNALFAGHEGCAGNGPMLASLIATCKMRAANPVDYITRTLRAMLDGHSGRRIEDLMLWSFDQRSRLARKGIGKALTLVPPFVRQGGNALLDDLRGLSCHAQALPRAQEC